MLVLDCHGVLSIDGSNSNSHQVCGVSARVKVSLIGEVILQSGNVSLDSLVVESHIFGDRSLKLCLISEDVTPFLDGFNILRYSFAISELSRDLGYDILQSSNATGYGNSATLLEVIDCSNDLRFHIVSTIPAMLHILEVIDTGELVKEASCKLGNHRCGQPRCEELGQEVCSVGTRVEIFFSKPVRFDFAEVMVDLEMIENEVLTDSLKQVARFLPYLSPFFNLLNVVIEIRAAGGQSRGYHGRKVTKILKCMDDLNIGEVIVDFFSFFYHFIACLEALLEFFKMVVTSEAEHETSNVVRNGISGQFKIYNFLKVMDLGGSLFRINWFYFPKKKCKSICEVDSGVEVFFICLVDLHLIVIIQNVVMVEEQVLCVLLQVLLGVKEFTGPGLDGRNVIVHVFAVRHGFSKILHGLTGLVDSLDLLALDVIFKSFKGFFEGRFECVIAAFDLLEMIVTSHTVQESSNKLSRFYFLGTGYWNIGNLVFIEFLQWIEDYFFFLFLSVTPESSGFVFSLVFFLVLSFVFSVFFSAVFSVVFSLVFFLVFSFVFFLVFSFVFSVVFSAVFSVVLDEVFAVISVKIFSVFSIEFGVNSVMIFEKDFMFFRNAF